MDESMNHQDHHHKPHEDMELHQQVSKDTVTGEHSKSQEEHADHAHHHPDDSHEMDEAHTGDILPPNHVGHPSSSLDESHTPHAAHIDHSGHEQLFRRRFWVSLVLSIPVLVFSPSIQGWLGFRIPASPGSSWIAPLFAIAVFYYGGLPFLKMALPELQNRQPGMMTLISLAISVAFIYSLAALFLPNSMTFFWELVTLIDIMLLGHWIEMRSIRQASGALQELAKLMPDTAEQILENGTTQTVTVSQLKIGDMLLIRPGASIPADGEVVEGESDVNESMLSGESRPVRKQPGAMVIAGTIDGDGSLHMRITATGDQTALAGIMRLVQQAQLSKSSTQLLADRAAGWLFYIALVVAALTAIAWTVAIGFSVDVIARVATVLVIACPHALGLAVPLVVAITTSIGARNGILVRDRLALEKSRLVNMVVFDKTGTLTEGEFGIVAMQTIPSWKDDDALALAAAIEGDSEHTIARGLRKSSTQRNLSLPAVSGFEAIKGRGVHALQNGSDVYIGGPRLLEMFDAGLPDDLSLFSRQSDQKGYSVVHLIVARQVVASFALADVIREESKLAVQALQAMKVEVAMLTGDSQPVAAVVAGELGIDTFYAEVLPEHKDAKIAELQQQGKLVAMVGDGVNDAPALARADVGIAIGSGTDVAIESAGIILFKNNPADVAKVLGLSRASYRKMIQNLVWAAGYNVVALPLAAGVLAPVGVLLSPAVGAILMSVSTIIVAINAGLLRGYKLAVLNSSEPTDHT